MLSNDELEQELEAWLNYLEFYWDEFASQEDETHHSWGNVLVHPKNGENFYSWLLRQAWKFRMSPKELLISEKFYWSRIKTLSLNLPHSNYRWLNISDILPLPDSFRNALLKRGLKADLSELQLDISKWIDITNKKTIRRHKLLKYFTPSLRYCPTCWKNSDKRYFRKIWRLSYILVCLDHGVELRETCPNCKAFLFRDERSFLYNDFSQEDVHKCRHYNHTLFNTRVRRNFSLAFLQNKIHSMLQSDSKWTQSGWYQLFWHCYQTVTRKQDLILLENLIHSPSAMKTDYLSNIESHLKLMEKILLNPPNFTLSAHSSKKLAIELKRRISLVLTYFSGVSKV
ncbi:MAG: TniQ family protein [Promethearchaeota archaeon]